MKAASAQLFPLRLIQGTNASTVPLLRLCCSWRMRMRLWQLEPGASFGQRRKCCCDRDLLAIDLPACWSVTTPRPRSCPPRTFFFTYSRIVDVFRMECGVCYTAPFPLYNFSIYKESCLRGFVSCRFTHARLIIDQANPGNQAPAVHSKLVSLLHPPRTHLDLRRVFFSA